MPRGFSPVLTAAALLVAVPLDAKAELAMQSLTYICDRGVQMYATYVNASEGSAAILQVEGRQVAMELAISGSGARYAEATDETGGSTGYIWWTKGDEAFLQWQSSATTEAVTILDNCRANP